MGVGHSALGDSGSGGNETIDDLNELQQDVRLLKATLERHRLQRDLAQLQPGHDMLIGICHAKNGIGTLTLNALYGVKGQYVATFSYNSSTQIKASQGDRLLCGETVLAIGPNLVKVEKNGNLYQITPSVNMSHHWVPLPQTPKTTTSGQR